MSFSGDYAALAARADRNAFAQVCEITLNEAEWDNGDGTLTANMYLSDRACRARSRAYDPRIVGWPAGLKQRIELKASGLIPYRCSVIVADDDGRVRDVLLNGNQRHSAVAIYRVIHGSSTAFDSRFTGLLDSWAFLPGQVELRFKTDERALWSNHPRWPLLRSEWFQMPQAHDGTPAALIYGRHDGTGLVDIPPEPHGMIPCVPVYIVSGSVSWWTTNLGPASFVKDVYVDGVLQTIGPYGTGGVDVWTVYGSLAGGKIFTIIDFQTIPADDAVVTANVYGYPAVNGLFDGTDVLTNPVSQIRHFLANWVATDEDDPVRRGYVPGAWYTTADIIDATSWDAAEAWAAARGLEGSRYLADLMSAAQRLDEWLESWPMFKAFWNSDGQIELAVVSTEWPGYWDEATPVIERADGIDNSFVYETDASEIARRITANYLYDSVDGKFLRKLDVEDLSVEERSDAIVSLHWGPARLIA